LVARDSADKKWSENDCTNKESGRKCGHAMAAFFFTFFLQFQIHYSISMDFTYTLFISLGQQTQLFFISLGQYQHYNNGSTIPNPLTQFP